LLVEQIVDLNPQRIHMCYFFSSFPELSRR
jgi:hypothetical protein